MNRGYAFGFLIVLLVVILGIYVALTGFMSSRDALRVQSTAEPAVTQAAQAPATATNPPPSPSPTIQTLPSPVPGITATLTAAVATDVPESPVPAETEPPPPPTQPPAVPSDTPPAPQPPTPAPIPAYQFRLAGPAAPDPKYPLCCYIYGTVRDAGGTPLEGIQVKAFNEWNDLPPALTKGGGEAGQYNIPIGRDLVAWYVIIVDAGGNQISSQVQVQFNADTANGYRVDWQRTY